jgi:hypothetical protein
MSMGYRVEVETVKEAEQELTDDTSHLKRLRCIPTWQGMHA